MAHRLNLTVLQRLCTGQGKTPLAPALRASLAFWPLSEAGSLGEEKWP